MSGSATVTSGATAPSTIVDNILKHKLATGGIDFGAAKLYDYPGEICEILGVADSGATDWDKELLVRNLASELTTKTNVFSVWGVVQTVKKNPANTSATKQGTFETKSGGAAADDIVTGEKRFEAIVERYIWPGKEGSPGNANVDATGRYNQTSSSQTKPGFAPPYSGGTWEPIDGPNIPTYPAGAHTDPWVKTAPNYSSTGIDAANNPAGAVMKYRLIYFRYLSD
jgi:hypothetical protein